MPLVFRLKDGLVIEGGRYAVIQRRSNVVEAEGELESRGEDWIFRFDAFEYSPGSEYRVIMLLSLEEGGEARWQFSYRIFDEWDMEDVEAEIEENLTGAENDFQRAMVRAAVYRCYHLEIAALRLLAAQGVAIGELMD